MATITKAVTQLHNMDHESISQLALDYLTLLLERRSMNSIAQLLRTTPMSIYRWLDEDKPLKSVSIIAASYIILMCEHDRQLRAVLESRPRPNSYYNPRSK